MPTAAKIALAIIGGLVLIGGCSAIIIGGEGLDATTTTAASPTAPPSPQHNAEWASAQKIADWFNNGGQTYITNIVTDSTAIGNDGTNQDSSALAVDCGTLKGHVSLAQAYAPIPDAEAQQHWAAALGLYKQAAAECVTGASEQSAELIIKASGHMTQGTSEINAANGRMSEIRAAMQ